MQLVSASAPRTVPAPMRDPVIPARPLAAACVIPARGGWPSVPHFTHRVAEGVIGCKRCGALWAERQGALPPFLQKVLLEREWRRLAVPRRKAVEWLGRRPFLEWLDPAAVWGWAEQNLGRASLVVFAVAFLVTRWWR